MIYFQLQRHQKKLTHAYLHRVDPTLNAQKMEIMRIAGVCQIS